MADYTFGTSLEGDFASAVERVTAALAAEGFGVLTTIDVQATLKEKLGLERDPYVILGACNPPLAAKALEADVTVGALLPCNVVVRQANGGVAVDIIDPESMLSVVDHPKITDLAQEVRVRLQRVAADLAA